jgi:hypothetical protein
MVERTGDRRIKVESLYRPLGWETKSMQIDIACSSSSVDLSLRAVSCSNVGCRLMRELTTAQQLRSTPAQYLVVSPQDISILDHSRFTVVNSDIEM